MADQDGGHEKLKAQLAFEKKCMERKLYRKPPSCYVLKRVFTVLH
jgi:hypothetical protein